MQGCTHARKRFEQVICRDGRVHVAEFCPDCGANVRGPGRWVPRGEVAGDVKGLPVHEDRRVRETHQPGLFDGF